MLRPLLVLIALAIVLCRVLNPDLQLDFRATPPPQIACLQHHNETGDWPWLERLLRPDSEPPIFVVIHAHPGNAVPPCPMPLPSHALVLVQGVDAMLNVTHALGLDTEHNLLLLARLADCGRASPGGVVDVVCRLGRMAHPLANRTRDWLFQEKKPHTGGWLFNATTFQHAHESGFAQAYMRAQAWKAEQAALAKGQPSFMKRTFPTAHARWKRIRRRAWGDYPTMATLPRVFVNWAREMHRQVDLHDFSYLQPSEQTMRKINHVLSAKSSLHAATVDFLADMGSEIGHVRDMLNGMLRHYRAVYRGYRGVPDRPLLEQARHLMGHIDRNGFLESRRYRLMIERRLRGKNPLRDWTGFEDATATITIPQELPDIFAYFFRWLFHLPPTSNGAPFDQRPCNPGAPWAVEASDQCFYPVLKLGANFTIWPTGFDPFHADCTPYQSLPGYFRSLFFLIFTPLIGPALSHRPQASRILGWLVYNATGHVCPEIGLVEFLSFAPTVRDKWLCGLDALPPALRVCMIFSAFWGVLVLFFIGLALWAFFFFYAVYVRMDEIISGEDKGFTSSLGKEGLRLMALAKPTGPPPKTNATPAKPKSTTAQRKANAAQQRKPLPKPPPKRESSEEDWVEMEDDKSK